MKENNFKIKSSIIKFYKYINKCINKISSETRNKIFTVYETTCLGITMTIPFVYALANSGGSFLQNEEF